MLLIPPQARLRTLLEEEWAQFGYALYADRDAPAESSLLRVGFGKHIGTPLCSLASSDPGYLRCWRSRTRAHAALALLSACLCLPLDDAAATIGISSANH